MSGAVRERRRPAVPMNPPTAVPAATCARQLPWQHLAWGRASAVVHATRDGQPICRLRVRRLEEWTGQPPLRLCSLCAAALTVKRLGRFWQPTRTELAAVHLHAADQLVAAVREQLADVRSAAIYDGSALVPVERIPTYRTTRGVPDGQQVPPPHVAVILGELLDRLAPDPVLPSPEEAAAAGARTDRGRSARQRLTDRTVTSTEARKQDLRAARQAKRGAR